MAIAVTEMQFIIRITHKKEGQKLFILRIAHKMEGQKLFILGLLIKRKAKNYYDYLVGIIQSNIKKFMSRLIIYSLIL